MPFCMDGNRQKMKTVNLPPYAPILMESTRAIGYSLEAAIADIIDNSIAADASEIQLNFFPVGQEYVSILDNGVGMDAAEITQAMQYGSKNPEDERSKKDLGRFGLGLKTASLSQCRILTVISKTSNGIECRQWNLDYVIKTGEWSLIELEEGEFSNYPQFYELSKLASGTLVIWQNLDRMKVGCTDFSLAMGRKMDDVREHLSLVYHRYLAGEKGLNRISISLNNVPLEPKDPFLVQKSQRPMDNEKLYVSERKCYVDVRAYVLPHTSRLTQEELKSLGGKEGLRKNQGFYVYRNKRLLVWGTWFKMQRKGELSKLVRVQVDVPNELDDLWTLDIKKSEAKPPEQIKNNLKTIIEKLAETSKRTWTYRGKKQISDQTVHVWNRLKTNNGGFIYEINREHPIIKNYMDSHIDQKKQIEIILRQIENNLPLDSLYIDQTNDVKIENDKEHSDTEIVGALQEILDTISPDMHLIILSQLTETEPFCNYKQEIDDAFKRGILR